MMLTVSLLVHEDFSRIAAALDSLYATTQTPCDVYVVINKGDPAKVEALRAQFPHVQYIINEQPQGFAANHNMIMQVAKTDYIALLNDDLELHEGALDTLVEYLQVHPQAGLVGPRLDNPDGTQQVSTYSDPSLFRTLYKISGIAALTHQQSAARKVLGKLGLLRLFKVESLAFDNRTRAVPIIKGAVMVLRRAAYAQVGGMDTITLAYGEEADWHWRLRQAGWDVVYVPEARVTHYGLGQAQLKLTGWMLREDRKASLNYYLKHRPRWQAMLVRVAIVLAHSFWGLVWLLPDHKRGRANFDTVRMALTFKRRLE